MSTESSYTSIKNLSGSTPCRRPIRSTLATLVSNMDSVRFRSKMGVGMKGAGWMETERDRALS